MDFDHSRSLAFLLSLAAVPMAGCPSASEGTATGTGNTSSDTSTGGPTTEPTSTTLTTDNTMTMTADSTGEPTTATTTDPSTDPTTDGTTTDPTDATTEGTTTDPSETTSDDDTTTSASTDDTTTTGGDASLCENAAAHIVECVPQYAELEAYLAGYCESTLAEYAAISRECGAAGEEYFACIAEAPCVDIQGNMPCPDEGAAVGVACGQGMEGGEPE